MRHAWTANNPFSVEITPRAARGTIHDVCNHTRLPLVDDSVALLVVDSDALGDKAPLADEIPRCLRPGGLGLVNRGAWK